MPLQWVLLAFGFEVVASGFMYSLVDSTVPQICGRGWGPKTGTRIVIVRKEAPIMLAHDNNMKKWITSRWCVVPRIGFDDRRTE